MMCPVRCFSCGKPVADKTDAFDQRVEQGESPGAVLDALGLDRYCCRRMLLAHLNLIDETLAYPRF